MPNFANKAKTGGFFQIDNAILDIFGAEIGPYGIAVYNALALHAGTMDEAGWRKCWPSHNRLAQKTGMSRSTVIRTLTRLEKCGLIRIETGRTTQPGELNVSNTYWLAPLDMVARPSHDEPSVETSLPKPELGATNSLQTAACVRETVGLVAAKHNPSSLRIPELDSLNQTHLNQTQESDNAAIAPAPHTTKPVIVPESLTDGVIHDQTHPANQNTSIQSVNKQELRQLQEFARQKFGGKVGQGVTLLWLENRVTQYGQQAVRAAITIAEERARPTASFISSVLERMTAEELANFDQSGGRLRVPSVTLAAKVETAQNAKGESMPTTYPFADFTPGFDDNPAAIERRIHNLRLRDALSTAQEQEYMTRLEWARQLTALSSE